MHHSGELDGHCDVEREKGEVVVDVVNHLVGGIHLGGELTKNACEDDGGETNIKKDELDAIGEAEHINRRVKRRRALVDDKHDKKHHELTTHEVAVQVVALEGDGGVLVREGVAVLVEIGIHGGQADKRSLLSFNHGEPDDGEGAHDECDPRVGVLSNTSVTSEHEGADDGNGEAQKSDGSDIFEEVEGGQLDIVALGGVNVFFGGIRHD